MAFPQVSTVLDAFTRADGVVDAGGGSTLWESYSFNNGTGGLEVISNQVARGSGGGAGRVSKFTLPADMELTVDIPTVGAGGSTIAIFFQLRDEGAGGGDWDGYFMYVDPGVGWDLYKRASGTNTLIISRNIGLTPLVSGDKIGIHRVDDAIRVRRYTSGAWDPTAFIDITDATWQRTGRVALEFTSTTWRADNLIGGAAVAEVGGGGGGGDDPTEPTTLWVDADHVAASDATARADVTESTPLLTVQQAGLLAFATAEWADDIKVKYAAAADPENLTDPSVYAAFNFDAGAGADFDMPFGDNTGNEPIAVTGIDVSGQQPKIANIRGRFLRNWTFENFQQGYDRGSGDDHETHGLLHHCGDLTFTDITYTGGGYYIVGHEGEFLWDGGACYSPYGPDEGASNFMDGAGWHIIHLDTSTGETPQGNVTFDGMHFEDINGEDAIQHVGGPVALGNFLTVVNCVFLDIHQGEGAAAAHTDCVQQLGGAGLIMERNIFQRCATPMIASDGENGEIRFDSNLLDGQLFMGVGIQAQGTRNLKIRNNTILGSAFQVSIGIGGRTEGVVQLLDIRNNLGEDFGLGSDGVYDEASVVADNIWTLLPAYSGIYGDNPAGLPEYGTSARVTSAFGTLGLTASNYELATTPPSPGVGDGTAVSGLTTDLLGRAFASPPDIGCLQSDPGTSVTAAARGPYLVSRTPGVEAVNVDAGTDVFVTLFPKPGEDIDPATVTDATFYVTDPGGVKLPGTLTVNTEADNDILTLDVQGQLFPYVRYTATLTTGVTDTEGSAMPVTTTWSFRVIGTYPNPAVGDFSSVASAAHSTRTLSMAADSRLVLPGNRAQTVQLNGAGTLYYERGGSFTLLSGSVDFTTGPDVTLYAFTACRITVIE